MSPGLRGPAGSSSEKATFRITVRYRRIGVRPDRGISQRRSPGAGMLGLVPCPSAPMEALPVDMTPADLDEADEDEFDEGDEDE
jgi:hypothetical protein